MGGIYSNVKVTGKTERLQVSWYKCQVNARLTFYHYGILKIESVVRGGIVGERTHKLIA